MSHIAAYKQTSRKYRNLWSWNRQFSGFVMLFPPRKCFPVIRNLSDSKRRRLKGQWLTFEGICWHVHAHFVVRLSHKNNVQLFLCKISNNIEHWCVCDDVCVLPIYTVAQNKDLLWVILWLNHKLQLFFSWTSTKRTSCNTVVFFSIKRLFL